MHHRIPKMKRQMQFYPAFMMQIQTTSIKGVAMAFCPHRLTNVIAILAHHSRCPKHFRFGGDKMTLKSILVKCISEILETSDDVTQ